MQQRRVAFTDAAWALIKAEAAREGVSAAQFVREASLFYAAWLMGRHGDEASLEEARVLIEQLRSE
jgi:hypothetical protein